MSYSKVEPYPAPGTYEEDHVKQRDARDKLFQQAEDIRFRRAFDLVNGDPAAMERWGHPGDWDHTIVDEIIFDDENQENHK